MMNRITNAILAVLLVCCASTAAAGERVLAVIGSI